MAARTVLATLPGSAQGQRLEVALVQGRDGRATIELCEQHHAAGIGWFGQRSLVLEPSQWRELQAVLGGKAPAQPIEGTERPGVLRFTPPAPTEPADCFDRSRHAAGGAG